MMPERIASFFSLFTRAGEKDEEWDGDERTGSRRSRNMGARRMPSRTRGRGILAKAVMESNKGRTSTINSVIKLFKYSL